MAIWGKVKQTRFVPITKSASAQSPALLMVIAPNIGWKGSTPPKTQTGLIFLKLGVYDLGQGGDRDQSGEVPWEGGGGAGGEKGRMDLGEQISSKESICTRIAPAGSN